MTKTKRQRKDEIYKLIADLKRVKRPTEKQKALLHKLHQQLYLLKQEDEVRRVQQDGLKSNPLVFG